MPVTCPDGHLSEAEDYCDTCGLEISSEGEPPPAPPPPAPALSGAPSGPAASSAPPAPPVVAPGDACSNCGTPRAPEDSFCEVCGLDFASGDLPAAPAPPAEADPAAPPAPSGWSVTITADRDWYDQQEMEPGTAVPFPDSVPARTLELAGEEMAIGRRSERSGWYPEVDLGHPVDDTGVSRRHALLRRDGDGWVLIDTGSTNGTVHNDVDLAEGVATPLAPGDRVNVGLFTRLTVQRDGDGAAPGGA